MEKKVKVIMPMSDWELIETIVEGSNHPDAKEFHKYLLRMRKEGRVVEIE